MMTDTTREAIEQALYANKYIVDEERAHIHVKHPARCCTCADRPCAQICPAAVYRWEAESLTVQYSGCLECGSCRFACPHDNLEWSYPRGGYGVVVKLG